MEKLRLLVLVDIPAKTRHERKVCREFLEWLFSHGFAPLQEGVFSRIEDGRAGVSALKRKFLAGRPKLGIVRLFVMTESQFRRGVLLSGTEAVQEREVGATLDIFLQHPVNARGGFHSRVKVGARLRERGSFPRPISGKATGQGSDSLT